MSEAYENTVAKRDKSGGNIVISNDANKEAFEDTILSTY